MNPWGITDSEAAFLDALCDLGTLKAASVALGLTPAAGQSRFFTARLRMAGFKSYARNVRPVPAYRAVSLWATWSAKQ